MTRRFTLILAVSGATALTGCDDERADVPKGAKTPPPAACGLGGGSSLDPDLTPAEAEAVRTLSPLPAVPPNPTNRWADDEGAARLGQRLFFETGFSGPLSASHAGQKGALGQAGERGKISCASCHEGAGLDDRRSVPNNVSLGADYLGRNSPTLVNASFYRWTNWAGRFSAQWELPLAVVENPRNMNGDRLRVAHVIFERHRAPYEAVFGPLDPALADPTRFPPNGKPKAVGAPDGPWESMSETDRATVSRIFVNHGKAIEAYLRKLVSRNASLDRYVAGDRTALRCEEKRGLKLFVGKAGCVSCHAGPHLSDGQFHNIGVGQTGERVPASDEGRFADIPPLLASPFNTAGPWSDDRGTGRLDGLTAMPPHETRGQFRTPTLRNVAFTAPYMHAGQLATLDDVVAYYDRGGDPPAAGEKDPRVRPLGLSAQERSDLVAFMRALTGDPLPATLVENPLVR